MRVAITGAGGGIGSELARIAAGLGAALYLSDLEAPESLAAALRDSGHDCSAAALDVTDRSAVEDWASACGKVDALVDCAAICPFGNWRDEGFDDITEQVLKVNLTGPMNLTRVFMARMSEQGAGRIVLVGSLAGRIGGILAAPHYVMTKGGIHSFIRWSARQGAPHGVLVNGVAPGPVATPMTAGADFDPERVPLKRMATTAEVAGPLAFFISPAAGYISGAILDINGGVHFS